ncbi:MAG: hypothetical protein K8S94_13685 [Planctomycetia bacterium]|nr:hypothetical protein [Planctomycetia bacterium]
MPIRCLLTIAAWLGMAATFACPFCGVVGRSLAERRDTADMVAVGESAASAARDPDGLLVQRFTMAVVLRGAGDPAAGMLPARVPSAIEGTALLFGTRHDATVSWEAIAADEALIGHVAAAPAVEEPAASRLRWFASRLEHPNPAIAADAFTEFGLAPFAAVREAADALDPVRLAAWVREPNLDQSRRGFFGLALGIVADRTADAAVRRRCLDALHAAVVAPANDLRAGFDGILAGVLVAEGGAGLERLRSRGLFAADTRPGDARHALAALRFAWESLAERVPRQLVATATADLLVNPAVAADCAIDLARYGRWEDCDRVAMLWDSLGADDPLVRRAVAGYLAACPLTAARGHRDRLAATSPEQWRAALAAAAVPAR